MAPPPAATPTGSTRTSSCSSDRNVANNQPVTDEVPARRQEERRRRSPSSTRIASPAWRATGCRRLPVERALRHRARRPLVRRAHRRRPGVPVGVLRALVETTAASTRRSSRAHTAASTRRATRRVAVRLGRRSSARAARRATAMRRFARLLVERPNAVFVWSMGLTQHAHGVRDGQGADQRRARARTAGPAAIAASCPFAATRACRAAPRSAARRVSTRATRRALGAGLGVSRVAAATRLDAPPRWSSTRPRATSTSSGWSAATSSRRCRTQTAIAGARLRGLRLRIHHDIVLSSSMLAESEGDVLLLPADDALRVGRRGHRDVHRAPHHLLAGNSRPPHRLGAARVAGVWRRDGARPAGTAPIGSDSTARPPSGARSRARSRSDVGSQHHPKTQRQKLLYTDSQKRETSFSLEAKLKEKYWQIYGSLTSFKVNGADISFKNETLLPLSHHYRSFPNIADCL